MLPNECLVLLDLLAVSFVLEQFPQVFPTELSGKRDESAVVAHFLVQSFDDVCDLVHVLLRSSEVEKVLAGLLAQRWDQVLIRCDVNIEPEAPWSLVRGRMTRAYRDLVDVAEDGVHGVRVVLFESYDILLALLEILCQRDRRKHTGSGKKNDEVTIRATSLFEPVVGVADDDLVDFDLPPIAKLDRQVTVGRVVVPAGQKKVSARVLFLSVVLVMAHSYLEMSILRAGCSGA